MRFSNPFRKNKEEPYKEYGGSSHEFYEIDTDDSFDAEMEEENRKLKKELKDAEKYDWLIDEFNPTIEGNWDYQGHSKSYFRKKQKQARKKGNK